MPTRNEQAYGMARLTWVDRLGVALSARAVRRTVARTLPGRRIRALDLGCGYHAHLLQRLAPNLASGTGVDFHLSPRLADTPNLHTIEGRVEQVLPTLPAGGYDLVLMINVLEHLTDDRTTLTEAHRVLAPDGLLLVNVPTWLGKRALEFSAFTLGLSPRVEMDDHKMYYGIRDLWPRLVSAGFRPSQLRLRYHKFGLNLYAEARRTFDA